MTYAATFLWVIRHPRSEVISRQYLFLLRYASMGAYAIYLFHRPVQEILNRIIGGDLVITCCASFLIMALAAVTWRLIEQPCIQFGQRRFRYQRPLTATPHRR